MTPERMIEELVGLEKAILKKFMQEKHLENFIDYMSIGVRK